MQENSVKFMKSRGPKGLQLEVYRYYLFVFFFTNQLFCVLHWMVKYTKDQLKHHRYKKCNPRLLVRCCELGSPLPGKGGFYLSTICFSKNVASNYTIFHNSFNCTFKWVWTWKLLPLGLIAHSPWWTIPNWLKKTLQSDFEPFLELWKVSFDSKLHQQF